MKKSKLFYASIAIVLLLISSCNKDGKNSVKNIAVIDNNASKAVTVKLKSMEKRAFSIGCHVFSSTTFNAENKAFGYMGCDGIYHIIDLENGTAIKRIPLPETISFAVLDNLRNLLIGHYYVGGSTPYDGTDHILTVNLDNGNIVLNRQFYVGGLWEGTTWFFRDVENEYVLIRRVRAENGWEMIGNELVFINAFTGQIVRTLGLDTDVGNGVYDKRNNRLIGSTYSNETGKNYIVVIDLNTGNTLSRVVAQGLGPHLGGEMDYDTETNSYILVSAENEVLFFDVETGEIKERYQLDFNITSLQFWRSKR